jgi:hypothetical protein
MASSDMGPHEKVPKWKNEDNNNINIYKYTKIKNI